MRYYYYHINSNLNIKLRRQIYKCHSSFQTRETEDWHGHIYHCIYEVVMVIKYKKKRQK